MSEIRIRNVNKRTLQQINNIHKNMGISISSMLKPMLEKFIAEQPEHLKKEYKE
jgi:antitoxin component of RelBE/YafQ-DinJ toxin-antitoxin module